LRPTTSIQMQARVPHQNRVPRWWPGRRPHASDCARVRSVSYGVVQRTHRHKKCIASGDLIDMGWYVGWNSQSCISGFPSIDMTSPVTGRDLPPARSSSVNGRSRSAKDPPWSAGSMARTMKLAAWFCQTSTGVTCEEARIASIHLCRITCEAISIENMRWPVPRDDLIRTVIMTSDGFAAAACSILVAEQRRGSSVASFNQALLNTSVSSLDKAAGFGSVE
jgi:hypothetical protein